MNTISVVIDVAVLFARAVASPGVWCYSAAAGLCLVMSRCDGSRFDVLGLSSASDEEGGDSLGSAIGILLSLSVFSRDAAGLMRKTHVKCMAPIHIS